MKKWIKKHIAIEWYTGYSNSFAFAEIYIENGFEGYTFQFVLFDKGFSITYHTKKALKWLRELERDLKVEFKKPIKGEKLVKSIMKDYKKTFKELKKHEG